MKLVEVLQHTIWVDAIRSAEPIVLDCGANRGDFARWAVDHLGATVYAFEADPILAATLPTVPRLHPYNVAIAGEDGTMQLTRSKNRCTSACFNPQLEGTDTFTVAARSLESIRQEHGLAFIDLIKLDIEGAEIEVLENISASFLAHVGQISCEFHDFLDATQRPIIRKLLQRLQQSGFVVMPISFWSYGDVLLINRRFQSVRHWDRVAIATYKYRTGIQRILSRSLSRVTRRG